MAALVSLAACADKNKSETDTVTPVDSVASPVDNTAVETDTVTTVPPAETTVPDAPVTVTVSGTVTGIQQGKDGYTAEITDDAGAVYLATISIPNLKDPKQYRAVKNGDKITVKGPSWKMEESLHIKAEELK